MKAISQFVVHLFDLIEAEGSSLRTVVRGEARRAQSAATGMAVAAALLIVTVLLLLAGCGLLGTGLMWWLQTQVSRPAAAGLTGGIILAAGAGCFVCFRVLVARRHA